MEYRVLGPIEALDGERRLPLGGPKQRALLAVLALRGNRVVRGSDLVEALWPEGAPATAPTAVQVYVSRLRKELPAGALETRPSGYFLRVERGELDAERFELLAKEGHDALARRDAAAAAKLREALALWRGAPFEGLELGGWARAEPQRLAELHTTVVEDRIDADLALGRHAELVGELEALVARHPLRERLRGQLMLALYRAGRQAEALEEYRAARVALHDELGLEPDASLQRLHGAILRQDQDLELAVPAAERTRAAVLFAILSPAGADDPEAVRDVLERAVEAVSSELRDAGGAVERGLAGALLGRFAAEPGLPLAAASAVRDRLEALFAAAVRARIGIELGEVLAGPGGLSGPPVAAASRLAGAAQPGQILVGPEAAAAAGDAFELRKHRGAYRLV